LILPHYQGKNWYEIPNGSWYSSWRARPSNGGASRRGPNVGVFYFYQCFADKAEGTQYDWKLNEHFPIDGDITDYSVGAGIPFARTYNMTITRISLAGCLDGCGGASGDGSVEGASMTFHAAFMPYVDTHNKSL
jgi:hypothetical protein